MTLLDLPPLATGFPDLDRVLPGGGIPRGILAELAGGPSSGKTSLAIAVLAAAQRAGEAVAFVDPERSFCATAAAAAGVLLDTLLLVRPPSAAEGFRAVDHLLRSHGFALVVLDATALRERPPLDRLFRVSRLAHAAATTVLLVTEVGSARSATLLGSPVSLRLGVTCAGFRFAPDPRPPFTLGGVRIHVEVKKNRFGPPGASVALDLALPET